MRDGTRKERRDPATMLGGEGLIVCYVDHLGRPHICHALLRVVEALFEQPEILGARGHERAVTDDADIVLAEGVSDAKQIASCDRTIGVVPGAEDLRFIRLFVQACVLHVVLMCAKQVLLYRNHSGGSRPVVLSFASAGVRRSSFVASL